MQKRQPAGQPRLVTTKPYGLAFIVSPIFIEQALDMLEDRKFDLAILDMHMPGKSGLDVIRLYKFMDIYDEGMPIIILSADVTDVAEPASKEAGADKFLTKPIEPYELLSAINELIPSNLGSAQLKPMKAMNQEPEKSEKVEATVSTSKLDNIASIAGDTGFVVELIHEFLEDADTTFAELDKAVNKGDDEQVIELAHTLKGTSINMGADALSNACNELQHEASGNFTIKAGRQKLKMIRKLLEESRAEMLKYIKDVTKKVDSK